MQEVQRLSAAPAYSTITPAQMPSDLRQDIVMSDSPDDKGTIELVEESGHLNSLTAAHQQYLLERHGRTDLDPLPSASPQDPLNWSDRKKHTHLVLVVFHAFMCTFSAAAVIAAFDASAERYGVTIHEASYLTSSQVCAFLPR